MADRLPNCFQPFFTWLTARPAPGETVRERSAISYVWEAASCTMGGMGAGMASLSLSEVCYRLVVITLAWLITLYGLGLFQVVVFHHASHGTVFLERATNRRVGWIISAILLFKHFDCYRREHLQHHSANKLLTEDDEFADFVLGMCRLEPGLPKRELWRRVIWDVVISPSFHARFLIKRVCAAWCSNDRAHNALGIGVWLALSLTAIVAGQAVPFLIAVVIPVTILLQVATVGRILCEHRFPDQILIETRGREFVCEATAGVFPGSAPPVAKLNSVAGWILWTKWWLDTLIIQLTVRLFFLVGDAPCHDYHHRRPATRKWVNYIQARQDDVDTGCVGYPRNYAEHWGLFSALDDSLKTLSITKVQPLHRGADTTLSEV